jgi:hypothetical protein
MVSLKQNREDLFVEALVITVVIHIMITVN